MVYVVFIFFIILLIIAKKNYTNIASYLISVYAFSVFFSILLLFDSDQNFQQVSLVSGIFLCVTLLFYFVPFFEKKIIIDNDTKPSFIERFSIIGYVMSILLIIGMILLSTKIREAFLYGLVETRQSIYKDETFFTSYTVFEHIGHSTLRWLSDLSYSILIMFFYALSFVKKKYLLKSLLFLSSLSAVYFGLMVGGRTNLIYWVLFFLFSLILFWIHLSKTNKRTILLISVVFLSILSVYFMFISVGRAELNSDGKTGAFLKSYAGQSILNFSYFFDNLDYHSYSLSRIFPLSSSILFERFDLRDYRQLIYSNSSLDIGVFYTFLGDLYVDVGHFGILVYSILYYHITKKIMKKKTFTLSRLLLLGICYQIPLHGIFYYSLWRMESTACVIITIIIAKFLYPNKSLL